MAKVDILGIKVDNLNTKEFIKEIIHQGHYKKPRIIFYANANTVNIADKDKGFKDILNKADIVYADGCSIVLASRILGKPLKERVNAGDFFDDFCKGCVNEEKSLYFWGASEEVLRGLYLILKSRHPSLRISGLKHGYFTKNEEDGIIEEINTLRPNLLIVGLGSPKQELFIYEHAHKFTVDTIWAVGGLFNLLSGKIKRAPLILRIAGLEWLYRLLQEPERLWRRYLIGNPVFLFRLLRETLKIRCFEIEGMQMYDFSKRLMDIAFSVCILFFSLPLFLLIYIGIKLDSPGPAIFKHKRIGKNGKEFIIYKFRTLYENINPYMIKPSKKDFCITNLGRFLRESALDELPQLWNVIERDMSLVGPRPEMPFIVETYGRQEKERLSVKPGITGLWQINRPKDAPIHANLEYDLAYMKNRSIFMDLKIVFKTAYLAFAYVRNRVLLNSYHVLVLFLYYSGLMNLFRFVRRKILKRFRLTVLLYHRVGDYRANGEDFVPVQLFEKQVKYLKKKYKVISIEEMLKIKNNGPDKDCVVITFDDAYKDVFLNANPVLEKYNLKATLFLTYEYLERDKPESKSRYLDWGDLPNLKNNFSFGSHTLTHPDLTRLSKDNIKDEIVISKEGLEKKLDCPVKYFSYPFGRFNPEIQNLVKDAGYECAFSAEDGVINHALKDGDCEKKALSPGSNNFCLKRNEIRNRPFASFVGKLEGVSEIPFLVYLRKFFLPP